MDCTTAHITHRYIARWRAIWRWRLLLYLLASSPMPRYIEDVPWLQWERNLQNRVNSEAACHLGGPPCGRAHGRSGVRGISCFAWKLRGILSFTPNNNNTYKMTKTGQKHTVSTVVKPSVHLDGSLDICTLRISSQNGKDCPLN